MGRKLAVVWRKLLTLPFCHGQGGNRVLSDVGTVLATTQRHKPENIILLSINIQLQHFIFVRKSQTVQLGIMS